MENYLKPGDLVSHAMYQKAKSCGIVLDVWFNFLNREVCEVAWCCRGKIEISEHRTTICLKLDFNNGR